MNFFKYYSSHPSSTIEDVLAPLRYHSLRYVTPDQFNDPYDCKCFFEPLDCEREDSFSEVINRHLRIACMSRNPSSPIMWSHYSTHHAGYVIEYDLPNLAFNKVSYKQLKPFYYSAKQIRDNILCKYPNIRESQIHKYMIETLMTDNYYMEKMKDTIFTKHIDWKYEQEYRFIDVNEKGCHQKHIDIEIEPKNVNSIILGFKFNHEKLNDELKRIINSTYHGNLTVYKAKPSLSEYFMKIDPYILK